MSRPTHVRPQVLNGARQLLGSRGARGMTLQSLAAASGVSRSAIIYHWPDKQALIRFLIQEDLDEWECRCSGDSEVDAFAAGVMSSLDATDGVGMLAAGLLPEAREDASVRNHVRETDRRRFCDLHETRKT